MRHVTSTDPILRVAVRFRMSSCESRRFCKHWTWRSLFDKRCAGKVLVFGGKFVGKKHLTLFWWHDVRRMSSWGCFESNVRQTRIVFFFLDVCVLFILIPRMKIWLCHLVRATFVDDPRNLIWEDIVIRTRPSSHQLRFYLGDLPTSYTWIFL